jgi:hypothetical protein
MAKTIVSVSTTVTYQDGTSDTVVVKQGKMESPFFPGGAIITDAPARATPKEQAENPGKFDGDPNLDPTLGWAPQHWEGSFLPPYPPAQRMCDMARADIELAREVWKRNLGTPLNEGNLTAAQRKRCGL